MVSKLSLAGISPDTHPEIVARAPRRPVPGPASQTVCSHESFGARRHGRQTCSGYTFPPQLSRAPPPRHLRCSMVVTQEATQPVATLDLAIALADTRIGIDDHVGQALVVSFSVIQLGDVMPSIPGIGKCNTLGTRCTARRSSSGGNSPGWGWPLRSAGCRAVKIAAGPRFRSGCSIEPHAQRCVSRSIRVFAGRP